MYVRAADSSSTMYNINLVYETPETMKMTQSLALFVGVCVAILLPTFTLCIAKFTCRRRFLKKRSDIGTQRITRSPPKQEQVIVWTSGLSLFFFTALRTNYINSSIISPSTRQWEWDYFCLYYSRQGTHPTIEIIVINVSHAFSVYRLIV